MDFVFGIEDGYDILKTVDGSPTELNGYQKITQTFGDIVLTDSFNIARKLLEKTGADGKFYKWYEITDHKHEEGRTGPQTNNEIDKLKSEIEYLKMIIG